MSVPTWELVKENVAPAKRGRDTEKIRKAALGENTKESGIEEEFERRVSQGTSGEGDVLCAWLEYARYVEEAYPNDNGKSVDVLERCARSLKDEQRYRNDDRYVGVWLEYASWLSKPDELFRYLHKRKIGEKVEAFWIAWAESAEAEGRQKLAADVYRRGSAKLSDSTLLEKRRGEYEKRREDAPVPSERGDARRPLADPARRRQPRQSRTTTTTSTPAAPTAPAIFVDEDLQQATPLDDNDEKQNSDDDWPDFGTRIGRSKENTQVPSRWTDAALGDKRPAKTNIDDKFIDIFVDDTLKDSYESAKQLQRRESNKFHGASRGLRF